MGTTCLGGHDLGTPEIFNHVGDILHAEGLLQTFGHQGTARRAKLLDLGPKHRFLGPFVPPEPEGRPAVSSARESVTI